MLIAVTGFIVLAPLLVPVFIVPGWWDWLVALVGG